MAHRYSDRMVLGIRVGNLAVKFGLGLALLSGCAGDDVDTGGDIGEASEDDGDTGSSDDAGGDTERSDTTAAGGTQSGGDGRTGDATGGTGTDAGDTAASEDTGPGDATLSCGGTLVCDADAPICFEMIGGVGDGGPPTYECLELPDACEGMVPSCACASLGCACNEPTPGLFRVTCAAP